jgi:hypothetical protein
MERNGALTFHHDAISPDGECETGPAATPQFSGTPLMLSARSRIAGKQSRRGVASLLTRVTGRRQEAQSVRGTYHACRGRATSYPEMPGESRPAIFRSKFAGESLC